MRSIAGVVVLGGDDPMTRWLRDAIRRPIELASGLPVEALSNEDYRASMSARPRGKFCVGSDLSPEIFGLLDANEIGCVDIRIHPIRFLDDLLFAVRLSRTDVRAALATMAFPDSRVLIGVGLVEAMCRLIADSHLPANTLLVVGRCDEPGATFDGHAIESACRDYSQVLIKASEESVIPALALAVAGVSKVMGTTRDNLYRLLAMPEIAGVLTDDASVAEEARRFDKHVFSLAKDPIRIAWRGDPIVDDDYLSFDDAALCADFWRLALAPHADVTPLDGLRLPAKPNRLRISLNRFGEYHEIDTGRIPAPRAS